MKFTTSKTTAKLRIKVSIRLDDECKNGHENFAITGETWELVRGQWREDSCGCIHDEIAEHFPQFAPFVALHLCTNKGVPMHAVENGFYWYRGIFPKSFPKSTEPNKSKEECKEIMLESLRLSEDQFQRLVEMSPRTKLEFSHALETLGMRKQWQDEANAAIAQLEALTGETYTPAPNQRETWEPLTAEQVAEIEARKANGYYTAEQVARRDEAALAEKIEQAVNGINANFEKDVLKLENNRKVALYFASRGMFNVNAIFYDHTNELAFNWSSTSRLWTRDEFDKFTATAKMSDFPSGMTLAFNDRPKY